MKSCIRINLIAGRYDLRVSLLEICRVSVEGEVHIEDLGHIRFCHPVVVDKFFKHLSESCKLIEVRGIHSRLLD